MPLPTTLTHLECVSLQPVRVLKPTMVKATPPNGRPSAPYSLLRPRVSYAYAYSSPLPANRDVQRLGRRSCSAARTKARDDAEPEPPAPAKEGEAGGAPAEGTRQGHPGCAGDGRPVVQRSMAYRLLADIYVCLYVFSWRTGQLIYLNAQFALERLHKYVVDKFSRRR
ncbi:hypothetical protein ACP70R_034309 [Stipagrostis hirtigluma subsp. patula]